MRKAEALKEDRGLMRSYEMVAHAIEQRILDNEIAPGDILPSETVFAAQLGVNRSTLREALRALEQNGLVMREVGRKKLRVSAPQPKDIARRIVSSLIIRKVSIFELYEAMCVLEPACAGNAATRRDEDDILALEDNLAQTRQAIDDRESLVKLDIMFHKLVGEAARNRALDLAREPLSDLFYPAFYPVMSRLNAAERLLVAHGHIVDAIKAKDAETARSWMERHIMDFRRGCELANLDMDAPVSISVT
jgi:GntR family transcriptional repressor for pyruvate dehydrogenase complex